MKTLRERQRDMRTMARELQHEGQADWMIAAVKELIRDERVSAELSAGKGEGAKQALQNRKNTIRHLRGALSLLRSGTDVARAAEHLQQAALSGGRSVVRKKNESRNKPTVDKYLKYLAETDKDFANWLEDNWNE